MMKNSIRKVGTTFLGLSCLLGGVLTFTGCETYEDNYRGHLVDNTIQRTSGIDYRALADQIEVKLTRTYNVDTVKLYNACIEMTRDYKFTSSKLAGDKANAYIYKTDFIDLKVVNSDKPSKAGESGYISLANDKVITTSDFYYGDPVYIYDDDGVLKSKETPYVYGEVSYEPTLYIEKGSSENTSILTIKPRFETYYHWWNARGYDRYIPAMDYHNWMFERDFANSILDGVQNCIR